MKPESYYLLVNLSEHFFDTTVGPSPNLARMCGYRRDWLSPKKNLPTPPQRGLGVIYWCLWVAWFKPVVDRKLLERLMSPSPKSQVMFASAFSWIGDFFTFLGFIFFKLWRVWCQPFATSLFARWHHSCPFATSRRCVYKESGSPSWTLDQPGTVTVGSGPRTLAGPRWQIGDTMNKGGPLTMQNVTWRR